jgi:hypothetical protein
LPIFQQKPGKRNFGEKKFLGHYPRSVWPPLGKRAFKRLALIQLKSAKDFGLKWQPVTDFSMSLANLSGK